MDTVKQPVLDLIECRCYLGAYGFKDGKASKQIKRRGMNGWRKRSAVLMKQRVSIDTCRLYILSCVHVAAQLTLGLALLQEGHTEKAVGCLRRAGELGDKDALYNLAITLPEHCEAEANEALTQSAALGQPDAMFMLAEAARAQGDDRVFQDLITRSAEQDHPEAAFALADAMHHGPDGFESDARYGMLNGSVSAECCCSTARSWYQRSAEQGYAPASCTLGAIYYSGIGVRVNHVKASL